MNSFFSNLLFLCLCVSFNYSYDLNRVYCYHEFCEVPLSEGYAQHSYLGQKTGYLNLMNNAKVSIHGKVSLESGKLYLIKLKDKYGWIPDSVIRETKIFHKDLAFSHPFSEEFSIKKLKLGVESAKVKSSSKTIAPNYQEVLLGSSNSCRKEHKLKIAPDSSSSYQVIDGTTLAVDFISPTSSEHSVEVTGTYQPTTPKSDTESDFSIFDADPMIPDDDKIAEEDDDDFEDRNSEPDASLSKSSVEALDTNSASITVSSIIEPDNSFMKTVLPSDGSSITSVPLQTSVLDIITNTLQSSSSVESNTVILDTKGILSSVDNADIISPSSGHINNIDSLSPSQNPSLSFSSSDLNQHDLHESQLNSDKDTSNVEKTSTMTGSSEWNLSLETSIGMNSQEVTERFTSSLQSYSSDHTIHSTIPIVNSPADSTVMLSNTGESFLSYQGYSELYSSPESSSETKSTSYVVQESNLNNDDKKANIDVASSVSKVESEETAAYAASQPVPSYEEYTFDMILELLPSSFHALIHDMEDGVSIPSAVILAIIGICCIVLLSIYYIIQQLSRESKLKNVIAVLDRELYQLKTAVGLNLPLDTLTTDVSNEQQEAIKKLSYDLDSEKKTNKALGITLESKNKQLEGLLKECESLKEQMATKESEVSSSNVELIGEIKHELTERDLSIEKLEVQLEEITNELESVKSTLEAVTGEKVEAENSTLEASKSIANLSKEKAVLEAELKENQDKIKALEENLFAFEKQDIAKSSQINVLEQAIKSIDLQNGLSCDELLEKINKLGDLQSQLNVLEAEKLSLTEKQDLDEKKIRQLEGQLSNVEKEAASKNKLYKLVMKEKLELNTKLEVLSNYYKDKENVLMKELTEYREKNVANAGDNQHLNDKIASLETQLSTYKSKSESLNSELESQERSFKSMLSQQEKKAHDNWLSARQAERKIEEMKQELSQLRGKLTQVEQERLSLVSEKNMKLPSEGGLIKPVAHRANSDGDLTQDKESHFSMPRLDSPPMSLPFMPLPPPGVLPPPPIDGPFPGMLPPDFDGHSSPIIPHPHHPPPPHLFDIRPAPLGRRSPPPPPYYNDSYPSSMMDDNHSESGRSRTRGGGSPSSVRSHYSNHRMTPDFESHSSNKMYNRFNTMPRSPHDDMHVPPYPPSKIHYMHDFDRDEHYRNGVAPSPPVNRERRHREEI